MAIVLSDQEKQAIRETLSENVRRGLVSVEVCDLCGLVEWVSTQVGAPDDVVVAPPDPYRGPHCRRCDRVRHLHPEVFAWVERVVAHQRRVAAGAPDEARARGYPGNARGAP